MVFEAANNSTKPQTLTTVSKVVSTAIADENKCCPMVPLDRPIALY
jgi:hypothetical protein